MKIKIAWEFSAAPGGRYRNDGLHSGEEFRENVLMPKYIKARDNGDILYIDFDDCYGFSTGFLEEAFGGLVRETGDNILDTITIIDNDDIDIEDTIKEYVEEALEEYEGEKQMD